MTIREAKKAGVKAFREGRPCGAFFNEKFLKAAIASTMETVRLLGAYNEGWTVAHLASVALDDNFPSVKALAQIEADGESKTGER
jgi:hypothetical protein